MNSGVSRSGVNSGGSRSGENSGGSTCRSGDRVMPIKFRRVNRLSYFLADSLALKKKVLSNRKLMLAKQVSINSRNLFLLFANLFIYL